MRYSNIQKAEFISRENRFVATVSMNGEIQRVHVKNTGRCREILVPGSTVWLVKSDNIERKYLYDLVAAEKENLLINVDSQAANQVFYEFLQEGGLTDGITCIRPEYTFGASRVDFYFERGAEKHLVEIKGCTLEKDGVCRFPDAPTLRGTKHLRELTRAVEQGYCAWICFVVQMQGRKWLEPNADIDPVFTDALSKAAKAGVHVRAFGCQVEPDMLQIMQEIPVCIAGE